jgi:aromatic-L-amino-acid decarboxylase
MDVNQSLRTSIISEAIERGIELAETAEKILRQSPCWDIVSPAQMGIVTFRYTPDRRSSAETNAINQRLEDEMVADSFAMVGL